MSTMKPLTMTGQQQRRLLALSPLKCTLMLTCLIIENSGGVIDAKGLSTLSGYGPESVKRGLRALIADGLLEKKVERVNGKFLYFGYKIINDMRGTSHA